MKFTKNHFIFIFLLLLLSIPSIWYLLQPGFFQSDDGEWMIIRFSAFYQALRDGQFPVRWLGRLNHEYGYPVANFLYPGFMYLGVPIQLLTSSFVTTVKILFGLSMVSSSIFAYLWLARIFGNFPGFVGGLIFLYAPYHLFDLYKRGSLGEVLALSVVPFILWSIERRSLFFSTIGIALLILSHNTLALLFLPIIFAYLATRINDAKNEAQEVYRFSGLFELGLGMSAFFWLPAIYDLQYTIFSKVKVSEWSHYFVDTGLIGWPTIIVMSISLVVFFFQRNILYKTKQSIILLFLVLGIVSIFLSTSMSSYLWEIGPHDLVQFPFRVLSITILCVAFLGAMIISLFKDRKVAFIGAILVAAFFAASFPYLKPERMFDKGDDFYATNMDTTTVKNEYMPKWVKEVPSKRADKKVEVDFATTDNLFVKINDIRFTIATNKDTKVTVNTIYFPGWRALIDGKETSITYTNEKGIMELYVPAGMHAIRIHFAETAPRMVADVASLSSLAGLILLVLKRRDWLVLKRKST